MHYYKKNIGDYHKKAGRLSMLQHGAFNLLMDSCYDREEFPTREEAIDWLWASSKEEIEAIDFVLTKFFILKDGRYIQNRISEEVQEYHGVCQSNAINGKKGGRPKGSKNKPRETHSVNLETHSVNLESESKANKSETAQNKTLTTNHEPLTTNHEPIKEPAQRKRFAPPARGDVHSYMLEREMDNGSAIPESEKFIDHYISNGWKVGRNPMKDWKAAVRNWMKGKDYASHRSASSQPGQIDHDDTSWGNEFLSQSGDS